MCTDELVSVVITTYKRPSDILMRAVNSVLMQTYPHLECIVVNDAPEEHALAAEIRKALQDIEDARVRYIEHERNLGSNTARNTGIAAAGGSFIAFLDDDDAWALDKLERQLEAFASHPDAALVYGSIDMVKNGKTKHYGLQHPGVLPLPLLLEHNVIGSTSFPLMKTSVLKEVGSFDPEQKSSQDYELWLRIVEKYPAIGIEDCMGTRYYSDDSVFHAAEKGIAGDRRIQCKHQELFRAYPRAHGNHLLGTYLYFLRKRKYRIAFRYKLEAWKVDPTNPENWLPVQVVKLFWSKRFSRRR